MDREANNLVLELVEENLDQLNRSLRKRGFRAFSSKINRKGLAKLMYADRGRVAQLLDGDEPWTVADLNTLFNVLNLDPSSAEIEQLLDRLRSERRPASTYPSNGTSDDVLCELNRWGSDWPLIRDNHNVTIGPKPAITDDLVRKAEEFDHLRGKVATVTRVGAIDWHEGPGQATFDLEVAEIDYQHAVAARGLAITDEARLSAAADAVENGDAARLIELMPYSLASSNTNIVTSDGRVVVAQRSGLVYSYKNQWNLGINEGLKASPDDGPETLFDLAVRAVKEELSIEPDAIKKVAVNWFGYCFECCNFYSYAHVLVDKTSEELRRSRHRARDARELSRVEFPELTHHLIDTIEAHGSDSQWPGSWLHHAQLSARMLDAALPSLGIELRP